MLFCVCCVLGHLALAHQCERLVCSVCSVLGTFALVHRFVLLVCCVCGVPRDLAPVNRCARSVCFDPVYLLLAFLWLELSWSGCISTNETFSSSKGSSRNPTPAASDTRGTSKTWCVVCAVSLATLAAVDRCASWTCCVCGVLGHLAPVHRCARSVCCVWCGVSLASWILLAGALGWCAARPVSLIN